METREIELWATLYIFPEWDRAIRREYFLFDGDEDMFAEAVDAGLQEWIGGYRRFGVRNHGWKYVSP